MQVDAVIYVCAGPPQCDGKPEPCEWCACIDPNDPHWQEKLERDQKGN